MDKKEIDKEKINVWIFIDALGWKISDKCKFMPSELPFRMRAKMQFGYSSSAVPTILSGKTPSEHGHFSFFYYDPKNSPFKIFRGVKYFFGAGLHPKCILNRGRVRHYISNLFARLKGYTGYFNLYTVPFEKLKYFNYCEKKDIFAKNGLFPCENLRDVLEKSGVEFHISNWRKSDSENFKEAVNAIKNGAKFLFIYCGSFDSFMHSHAGDWESVSNKLPSYAAMVEQVRDALAESGKDWKMSVISDHGMTPLKGTVDISSALSKLPLKFGRDCVWFLDSTMARFWYLNEDARRIVRKELSKPEFCGAFVSDSDKKKYGIDFADNRFGEDIFLTDDGIQICPCDLGPKPLMGMHGFSPEAEDSYASFLSTEAPAFEPKSVADFFKLMKLDIDNTSGK